MPVPETVNSLLRSFKRAKAVGGGWLAAAVAPLEPGNMIVGTEPGEGAPELGPRVAVFCHFDGRGRILPHTRLYIDALRAEGFDVVFVTNSPKLSAPDQAWIRRNAARVLTRRNIGYDFGAWRDAIATCKLPLPGTQVLVIANDSVYGPLRPLGPMLERLDFSQADVWSATDSWQHQYHLQSFFVAFGPKALAHPAFGEFWRSVRNVRSKWWIITRYEVGLSRALLSAGLRCRAMWPYLDVIRAVRQSWKREHPMDRAMAGGEPDRMQNLPSLRRLGPFEEERIHNEERILRHALHQIALNPTADLWRLLIEQGFPFLKRELLRFNPSQVPGVGAWSDVVETIDGTQRDLIVRDLESSLKGRAP